MSHYIEKCSVVVWILIKQFVGLSAKIVRRSKALITFRYITLKGRAMTKVMFTAGLFIKDRPERWDFVLRHWEVLSSTMKSLGVDSRVFCHPVLHHPVLYENPIGPQTGVITIPNELDDILNEFRPDYLFIWNGGSPGDKIVIELAEKHNVKVIYAELGWFPQKDNLYFDLEGVNADSSFNQMKLLKLTEEEDAELALFRVKFFNGKPLRDPRYHLIVLQDEGDTNIINSRFKSMEEFVKEAIWYIRHTHCGIPIVVKKHPHQADVKLPDREDFNIGTATLYNLIMGAKQVHAVNSTVLLEAAMLNVPVRPYDDGIIRHDILPYETQSLLYHLIKRQLRGIDLCDKRTVYDYPLFQEIFHKEL